MAALSVIPTPEIPQRVPHLDKVVHLCEYLVLAWLLGQALRYARPAAREFRTLAWIYATTYGMMLELIQRVLPWRSADGMDILVNALGAIIGVFIAQTTLQAET